MQFRGYGRNVDNQTRIAELNQEHAKVQAASEGFNASLSGNAAYELELRREKDRLLYKASVLQWATEGCNGGLSVSDLQRLEEIDAVLDEITPEPKKCHCVKCESASTGFENLPDDIRYSGERW